VSTFKFLQEKATERGCKLQRAKDYDGYAKPGYVIKTSEGFILREQTLKLVWNHLRTQAIKEPEASE
jgi:hypothetical protein